MRKGRRGKKRGRGISEGEKGDLRRIEKIREEWRGRGGGCDRGLL